MKKPLMKLTFAATGLLVLTEATALAGDSLFIGEERRLPTRYAPAQYSVAPNGSVTYIPPTPTDFETFRTGSDMGVPNVQTAPAPADPRDADILTIRQWITQLKSFKPLEQKAATDKLVAAGDRAVEPILANINAAAPRDQKQLVDILGLLNTRAADLALAELAVNSRLPTLNAEVILVLRLRRSADARERLVELALKPDDDARARALRAIQGVGDRICIRDLIAALAKQTAASATPNAKRPAATAALALHELTGQPHGENLAAWQTWWLDNSRTFRFPGA